jgi:hypothetical protein
VERDADRDLGASHGWPLLDRRGEARPLRPTPGVGEVAVVGECCSQFSRKRACFTGEAEGKEEEEEEAEEKVERERRESASVLLRLRLKR